MCVFISSTTPSDIFLILKITRRYININVHWPSSKVPVICFRCKLKLTVFYSYYKNLQISNLMKILPVGAELFHAEGRKDVRTYTVGGSSRFTQFC